MKKWIACLLIMCLLAVCIPTAGFVEATDLPIEDADVLSVPQETIPEQTATPAGPTEIPTATEQESAVSMNTEDAPSATPVPENMDEGQADEAETVPGITTEPPRTTVPAADTTIAPPDEEVVVTPVDTEVPALTETPVPTEAPVPEMTEVPEETDEPVVTEAPATTDVPNEEPDEPAVTEIPATTEAPEETETPTATPEPTIEESGDPESTAPIEPELSDGAGLVGSYIVNIPSTIALDSETLTGTLVISASEIEPGTCVVITMSSQNDYKLVSEKAALNYEVRRSDGVKLAENVPAALFTSAGSKTLTLTVTDVPKVNGNYSDKLSFHIDVQ